MNGLSQRQLLGVGLPLVAGVIVALTRQDMLAHALAVGAAGALGAWLAAAGGASAPALDGIVATVRRLRDGRRPELPAGADPSVKSLYDELTELHENVTEIQAREEERLRAVDEASRAVSDAL